MTRSPLFGLPVIGFYGLPRADSPLRINKGRARIISGPETMAVFAIFPAFFIPPLGIVLSHIALYRMRKHGLQSQWLAITTMVISYLMLAVMTAVVILIVVSVANGSANGEWQCFDNGAGSRSCHFSY